MLDPGLPDFLRTQTAISTTGKPRAFLNWILLDEQFKFVQASSGSDPVPSEDYFNNGTATPRVYVHQFSGIPITKNGYLYVYVSNETPNIDVYFDNLQVTHVRGPLLEETHYYPFGLTMAGISSKAVDFGGTENKRKFNGIEHTTDLDMNQYDAFYRNLDPQIGRWWQIDPKHNLSESPYCAMNDNPFFKSDFLGDTATSRNSDGDEYILRNIAEALMLKKNQINPIKIDEETGVLSVNKKAYKKLNSKQKNILTPLVNIIKSTRNIGLNVVSKDQIITKTANPILVFFENGTKILPGKTVEFYGGGVTSPENWNKQEGKVTTEIYLQREENNEPVNAMDGKKIGNCNYVIIFHEIGHAYYRDVLCMPFHGCKAIDEENNVRKNNNLLLRAYDNEGEHADK